MTGIPLYTFSPFALSDHRKWYIVSWIEIGILGIIQGLTEFLPVSSTGHLFLGRVLFGMKDAGLYLDTMLHIGTLLAVITVYWRELLGILRKPFSKLTALLIVGTIPAVLAGLAFNDFFEGLEKSGVTIGWEFLVTAIILWVSDEMKNRGTKDLEQITFRDALIIGVFQAFAIFPAISRSGMTIAAALFCRIRKDTAAYYSFLLSIPAIAGAILLQLLKIFRGSAEAQMVPTGGLLLGIVTSAVFGYLAVRWMINLLKKGSLKGFALYVWCVAIFVAVLQILGKF